MTPGLKVEGLRADEVFGFLRPEQVDAISEVSHRITCAPGDVVYEEGARADHFFTILEGEVALRLHGRGAVSVVIDQLRKGDMFGSCVCFGRDTYALTGQCTKSSELLKVENAVLQKLMDDDLKMGYALQTRISGIYFHRYVETMKKLQAIVMNIPFKAD